MNSLVRDYLINQLEEIDAMIKDLEKEYRHIAERLTAQEGEGENTEKMEEKKPETIKKERANKRLVVPEEPKKVATPKKKLNFEEEEKKIYATGMSYAEYQKAETLRLIGMRKRETANEE